MPSKTLLDALKSIENPSKGSKRYTTILKCVLITSHEDAVTLTTTDMASVSCQITVPATVITSGALAVPVKVLKAALPSARGDQGTVTVVSNDNSSVDVVCSSSSSKLSTLNADDFPNFPEDFYSQTVALDLPAISSIISAASKEEWRPILTTVCFDGSKVVATDSYQMNICHTPLMHVESDSNIGETEMLMVPAQLLASVVKKDAAVMCIGKHTVTITDNTGMITVISRVEGSYVKYDWLIPEAPLGLLSFDRDMMLAGIKTIVGTIPAADRNIKSVTITEDSGQMKLSYAGVNGGVLSETSFPGRLSPGVEKISFNAYRLGRLLDGYPFAGMNGKDQFKPCSVHHTDAEGRIHTRILMPTQSHS